MNNNIFVRLDKKISENKVDKNLFKAHLQYIEDIKNENFLIAGGFKQVEGGMIVFKADNRAEAEKICKNDPIIEEGYYDFDLYKWDIKYISKIKEVFSSG